MLTYYVNLMVSVLQRIEEEERKRRARGERPSLRARLAAKKAIVAANSAVPQRNKQREAQEAVASQRDIANNFKSCKIRDFIQR
jgi:hypothetical protein